MVHVSIKGNQFNFIGQCFILWYNWWVSSFAVRQFRWYDCFDNLSLYKRKNETEQEQEQEVVSKGQRCEQSNDA